MNRPPRPSLRPLGLALISAIILALTPASAAESTPDTGTPTIPSVGLEGRLTLTLPGAELRPKTVDPRSPILLRLAESAPHGSQRRYDLRYVGLEPGTFDLREFLERTDGSTVSNLPPLSVTIAGRLPEDHDGLLRATPPVAVPAWGGYRTAAWAVGVVWVTGVGIAWMRRRRPRRELESVAPVAPPTLADRLQPLVEAAAEGRLGPDGQAQLERLLLGYWCEKLGWEDLPRSEALPRLRAHPEAGELLRSLEDWLHRPRGVTSIDVAAVLAPYRSVVS